MRYVKIALFVIVVIAYLGIAGMSMALLTDCAANENDWGACRERFTEEGVIPGSEGAKEVDLTADQVRL